MSFGVLASWQALLLIAGAGVAAAWLFFVKVRPPRVVVPSLLLWSRVLDEARTLSRWERVRRAVSLAITVLIALALAVAVTRPGPRAQASAAQGRLLVVMDSSWSMRAEMPSGGTRWQRAVSGARSLVLSSGSETIALATTADGLVEGPTSDTALILTALERLTPSGGDETRWPRVDGVAATHFFTDGATGRALDQDVVIHSVYEPAPNVGITAFGARPATSSTSTASAYLEFGNYADTAQTVRLTVTRDAAVLIDRRVELQAGEVVRESLPLGPEGGARLRAHVTAPRNALAVDDDAVAWLTMADPVSLTVVSENASALADLFKHDPNVKATFVKPSAYTPATTDVVIFDRWLPATAPARPVLAIAPPASSWLGRPGREELAPKWTQAAAHPILDGVDPYTLDITKVRAYEGPSLTVLARSERGTSLVSVVDDASTRAVVLGFSAGESNLAAAPAFPVLIGNAIEWLARPAAGETRASGPVELPTSTSRVTAPDGQAVPLVRAGDRVMAQLSAPGLYLVEAAGSRSVIGVNVGTPDVANLTRTTLSEADRRRSDVFGLGGRPWWTYAVVLALVLLLAEWWTWQRRVTV